MNKKMKEIRKCDKTKKISLSLSLTLHTASSSSKHRKSLSALTIKPNIQSKRLFRERGKRGGGHDTRGLTT